MKLQSNEDLIKSMQFLRYLIESLKIQQESRRRSSSRSRSEVSKSQLSFSSHKLTTGFFINCRKAAEEVAAKEAAEAAK